MNIGDPEKDNYPLAKISGPSTPKDQDTSKLSDFEKEMFEEGVYEFNFDKEVDKANTHFQKTIEMIQHPPMDISNPKVIIDNLMPSANWDLAWKRTFSGKIPKSWGESWENVRRDFDVAEKRNAQLSPALVNAGISHTHPWVVNGAGRSQKLSPKQLGIIRGRPDIPGFSYASIVEAQKEKGVTDEEIKKAGEYSEPIARKFRLAELARMSALHKQPRS